MTTNARIATMTNENRDEYNGWVNRETWAAALWINNDQGMQEIGRDLAGQDQTGEAIEDWFDEMWEEFAGGATGYAPMFSDVGSLWRVDWREIRAALLEP